MRWEKISSVKRYAEEQTVYNLHCEPFHNYFANGINIHNCTFCSHAVGGYRWRPHSPGRVLQEARVLIDLYGVQELHFEDDNFTLDRVRAKKILEAIAPLGLSIGFPNGVRLDTLDDELLSCMKDAGVHSVGCGVEFGSQRILDKCNKGLTLEKIQSQITKIKKHGLYAHGFFIIGSPHEKYVDVMSTIDFATQLDLDAAFFGHYVPLPGSEDFDELVTAGKIDPRYMDWDNLFSVEAHDVSFYLSKKELANLRKMAYRRFYLRPSIAWRMLSRLNSMSQVKALLGRARSVF